MWKTTHGLIWGISLFFILSILIFPIMYYWHKRKNSGGNYNITLQKDKENDSFIKNNLYHSTEEKFMPEKNLECNSLNNLTKS